MIEFYRWLLRGTTHFPMLHIKRYTRHNAAVSKGCLMKTFFTDKHKFYVWNSYVGFSKIIEKRLKI